MPSLSLPRWTSLEPRLGAVPGAGDQVASGPAARDIVDGHAEVVGRQDLIDKATYRVDLDRVDDGALADGFDPPPPRPRVGPGVEANELCVVLVIRGWLGQPAEEGRHDQVPRLVPIDVPPAEPVDAADVRDVRQPPPAPVLLRGQGQLAPGRLVPDELVGNRDFGLAVAVEVRSGAADDAGRLPRRRDDPLLPGRVLKPGAGPAAKPDDVGSAVAVDVGHLDLIPAREIGVDDDPFERQLARRAIDPTPEAQGEEQDRKFQIRELRFEISGLDP